MTLGGKEPCGSKECTGTHFSQTQGPGLLLLRGDEWPLSGPSTLRPALHDCRQITRSRKGQILVTCLLLSFGAKGGKSDILSKIIIIIFFYFKSHKSKASEMFLFSLRFFYIGQLSQQINEKYGSKKSCLRKILTFQNFTCMYIHFKN